MDKFTFLKKLYVLICLIVVCSSLTVTFDFTKNNVNADTNNIDNVFDKIDAYLLDASSKAHFPAMSVTIVDKENVLLSKSYGECKSTNTPFLLGSVSKSFTALCVMQLVEQGLLGLDVNIDQYIPNSKDGNKITIRQLLNHTSGLGEHQNLNNYKIVGKQGVHTYANVNYSLLGKIIESVSNESYENYVAENVFKPLNMSNSAATLEKSLENGLISGYENWFGINVHTKPKYPNNSKAWISTSSGYLSASTSDLGKYLQMYLSEGQGIISKNSINKMFYEGVSVNASIPYSYGMGWTLIDEPLKEPALRHSGLVETGMAAIYILPKSEVGIAIAVNSNDYFVGKDFMDRIDWSVALLLMGDEPNQIGESEYVLRHLLYNSAYLAVFLVSILPICLISCYKRKQKKDKTVIKIIKLVLLHLMFPMIILLLSPIAFSTPLWVVSAFVPDMFAITVLSSVMLFIGGIIKTILIISSEIKKKIFFRRNAFFYFENKR